MRKLSCCIRLTPFCPVADTLTRLGNPTNDIARFCFAGTIHLIRHTPAYKLLMALSLFATDASRDALGYVADLPLLDRDEGLEELERLSLVNKEEGRFALLPLTKVYSEEELGKDGALEEVFRERLVEWLLEFLAQQRKNMYEKQELVMSEIENIKATIDWCWQTSRLKILIELIAKMDSYLWITGEWTVWDNYITLGLKSAILIQEELSQANFYWLLAMRGDFQGDLEEAKKFIIKAIRVYELYKDDEWLCGSIWRLASIQFKEGKHEIAKQNLFKAQKIAKEIGDVRQIARIKRRLAMIDIEKGNYDSALTHLQEARMLREEQLSEQDIPRSSGLSNTYRLLGQISLIKRDYQLAEQYIQHSWDIGEKIHSPHDVAEAKLSLAQLELELDHTEKAKQLAQEALGVFTKLRMKQEIREAQALLDKIAAQQKQVL